MSSHELVDLVDDQGQIQVTEVPLCESASSYPELHLQIAVAVVFNAAGRVLAERRALSKTTDWGHIDLVCGVVSAGEAPIETARRESMEETTIEPHHLQAIDHSLNSYGRYRFLFRGFTDELPNPAELNPNEVEWAKFMSPQRLRRLRDSGTLPFVGDFFENVERASTEELLAA